MKGGSGGAFVDKYEGEWFFTFVDQDAELRLLLGVDVSDCSNGNYQIDEMDFLDVYLPSADPNEFERLVAKTRGHNVYAQVWEWPDPPPANNCDYYSNNEPIATGTANVTHTDNDLYFMAPYKANAWGWNANGRLEDTNGQVYRLHLLYRAVWVEHTY
jgi:hypothetical protein